MDVDLRHNYGCQQLYQLGSDFSHLNHHHLAYAKGNIFFVEQFLHPRGVTRDYARNRGVGGLRYAQRDNVGVLRVQQLHNFQHCPDLIGQKYGELLDQRSFHF